MKRIVAIILSLLCFSRVSEAQLLPATVKKPTPPPVQKTTPKPVTKPISKPSLPQKENIPEQKPVVQKKTIALPAGPQNFNFNDNYVLFDDFSSNVNNWSLYNNSSARQEISNGRFLFNTKTEKGTFHTNLTFGFDNNQDFSVSVKTKWQDGVNNYGYGMNFCSSYKDNSYYIFFISSNGYYKIAYSEKNGSWKDLKAWTTSSLVNKGIVSNIIEVRRVGRFMEFYINEKMVERIPFEQPFGNDFGFRVEDKQTIEFDDLLIQGKSMLDNVIIESDEDALLEIGTAKAPLKKDSPFMFAIPKGLYNVSFTKAEDADEKSTFMLNARGQRDVITKPVQFKSRQTLKGMAQHSKVVLVPVMDQATTLWGFKDSATGKFLVPYQYDWADSMFDGMACVNRGKKFGFINVFGEESVPVIYKFVSRFSDGLSRVSEGQTRDFVDKQGEKLTENSFLGASVFKNGLAIVTQKIDNQVQWAVINRDGKQVISFSNYTNLGMPNEGLFIFKKADKYGALNLNAIEVIPAKFDLLRPFSEGLSSAKLNGKFGFIDKLGNAVIPFQYEACGSFHKASVWVKQNQKWQLIDKYGLQKYRTTFDDVNEFTEGFASVMVGGKWGLIDEETKWILLPRYDSLGFRIDNGLIPAKIGTKWGVIDKLGAVIVPFRYDQINAFTQGMASVKLNGKWGYINTAGIESVPIKYESVVTYFYDGLGTVFIDKKGYYVERNGKIISD